MKKSRLSTNNSLYLVNDTKHTANQPWMQRKTMCMQANEWCHFQWPRFEGHAIIRRWMSQKLYKIKTRLQLHRASRDFATADLLVKLTTNCPSLPLRRKSYYNRLDKRALQANWV